MHSSRRGLAVACLLAATALAACGCATGPSSQQGPGAPSPATTDPAGALSGTVTVLAAASLQDAFEELAEDFERTHPGVDVVLDFQGSQDLVSALAEGIDADVLATANEETMASAVEQGLVGTPVELVTNSLALIVPAGNPAGVTGVDDGSLEGVDLVVCAPQVPCGAATQALADELGLTLVPVSEEQKVTDVRGKVESGEADAGIVYATDAAAAGAAVESVALPPTSVLNHYPVAVTSSAAQDGNDRAARAFVDHLLSEEGRHILQDVHGFGPAQAR